MRKTGLKIGLLIILCGFIHVNIFGNNLEKSKIFEIQVDGKNVPVNVFNNFDVPIHSAFLVADVRKPLTIRIKAHEEIKKFSISPLSKNIRGVKKGNELKFTVSKPEYLVIKINDLEDIFLMIDAPFSEAKLFQNKRTRSILEFGADKTGNELNTDLIQKAIIETAENNEILYFPKGIYKTGQLNISDNSAIYLAQNACIKAVTDTAQFQNKALIYMKNVKNAKILGHGSIDGSGYTGLRSNGGQGYYLIFMDECKQIELNGLILLDPCFWNARVYRSDNVHLENIKVLNNRPRENWNNTDGIDFDSSENCSLKRAILHCGDDNLVVKGLDHEQKYNTENILFENIVTISNSASAKIGTETYVKHFNNIVFRDIDIVKCKRAIVINAYDSSVVKNVTFENINIESFVQPGIEKPRLIDFEITDTSWRPCTGNCKIEDVKLKNISVYNDLHQVDSQILGNTEEFSVRNILFENIKIKNKPIRSLDDIKLRTNEFVFNLKNKK